MGRFHSPRLIPTLNLSSGKVSTSAGPYTPSGTALGRKNPPPIFQISTLHETVFSPSYNIDFIRKENSSHLPDHFARRGAFSSPPYVRRLPLKVPLPASQPSSSSRYSAVDHPNLLRLQRGSLKSHIATPANLAVMADLGPCRAVSRPFQTAPSDNQLRIPWGP